MDDDTTPVALRAALLRQCTTPERAKTSKSRVLSLVLACICAASLANTRRERELLDAAFHMKLKLNLSVERMTAATVTHFFHAGRTAVYYLHESRTNVPKPTKKESMSLDWWANQSRKSNARFCQLVAHKPSAQTAAHK